MTSPNSRDERPSYVPVHDLPVWLSSEDVLAAITEVGLSRQSDTWRACCWDIGVAVRKLMKEAHPQTKEQPDD